VKNLIKKNQLMITALAIMIAIAGYLQFAGKNLDEEYLTTGGEAADAVNADGVITENYTADELSGEELLDGALELTDEDLLSDVLTEIGSLDEELPGMTEDYLDEGMMPIGETVSDGLTAEVTPAEGEIPGEAVFTSTEGLSILSDAKLLKEQTRARNKETLMAIINSAGLTDVQKQEAVNSLALMTTYAEKETASEILLSAKGFSDVVVSIDGVGVDVVINALELTDVQRAQIVDIVSRKTEVAAENITISTVVK